MTLETIMESISRLERSRKRQRLFAELWVIGVAITSFMIIMTVGRCG